MAADEAIPPVVCTLSLGKKSDQVLEWRDIRTLALSREAIENGVTSTFPLEVADKVEDLADREISCCGSWLEINHRRDAGALYLTLTTRNPEGLELIRSMSGLNA